MLRPFAWALKAHSNGRNKSQHCWVQQCWDLLALVAWCMQTNTTPANIVGVKVVILALITALSVPSFSSICLQVLSRFSSNNSLYLTRHRGKTFPREGQFFLRKYYKARAQTFSRGQHCWDSMQTVRRSQNNRNVGTCWAKGLTGFKLYATSANLVVPCKRTQQVATLLGSTMFGVVGQQPDELLVRVYKSYEYNRVESLVVEVLGTTLWRTLVGNVLPI